MKYADKIKKARIQLIMDHPFFASIALSLEYLEDCGIGTACTNGKQIRYNPQFIEGLPVKEVVGVLAHEVLHVISFHHLRRENRDPALWNIATDYAINQLLIKAHLSLPEGVLLADRFQDMSAEAIYTTLNKDPDKEKIIQQASSGKIGDIEDLPPDENKKEVEAQLKHSIVQAALMAKSHGNLPDFVQQLISDVVESTVDWKSSLQRFFTEHSQDDYTWVTPSTRYLYQGLYLPSLKVPCLGTTILIVDTSGSTTGDLMNKFAAEVQKITTSFNIPITIIYVDCEVRGIQTFEPDEELVLHPLGGDVTDFIPGFEYIATNSLDPQIVVYLTDGLCDSFPEPPAYNVLWAQFGHYNFRPPFGEVLKISY